MTYRTKLRLDTAFRDCYGRYGVRLRFNRGKVMRAEVENPIKLQLSGKTISYVIGKYKNFVRGK